mgnify:CR=1 FL=1
MCGDHESNPGGLIGGSWDQICLPWALRGPPGPKRGLLGPNESFLPVFSIRVVKADFLKAVREAVAYRLIG